MFTCCLFLLPTATTLQSRYTIVAIVEAKIKMWKILSKNLISLFAGGCRNGCGNCKINKYFPF